MGKIYIFNTPPPVYSDNITALRSDILKGKTTVANDSDDEIIEGTLELTGNAGGGDVLSGKTYYSTDAKTKMSGTMTNQGTKTAALNCGGSYIIPAGYHNGNGKITANTLSAQTSGTATAANILSGQTAWVNGAKVTGSMANQGTKTSSLNCGSAYIIPAGYHNGSGKVTANSLASQTGGATAGDEDVLNGKTYWKDGSKRTGTMPTMAGGTYTPSTSQQTISCSGKKMTGNIIINGGRVLKEKSGDYVTTSSTLLFNGDKGSMNSRYVKFTNIGFTPVLAVFFSAKAYTVAYYQTYHNQNYYFPADTNPNISFTASLIQLPFNPSGDNRAYYRIIGY